MSPSASASASATVPAKFLIAIWIPGERAHVHADELQHWQCVHNRKGTSKTTFTRGNNMTKDQRMPPDAHQVLYSAKCQSSTCVNKDVPYMACQSNNKNASFVSDCVKRRSNARSNTCEKHKCKEC